MATLSPDQLVAGYQAATESVRARVLAYASSLWMGSPGFRDADVERLIARIVPVVQAGQVQVAQITDSYVARMALLSGVSSSVGVDAAAVTGYRGVAAEVVYRRPAVSVYTALSKGETFATASAYGLQRLTSLISTDVQQSKNRQATKAIAGSGFSGARRVLSGAENCAFCVIASTQRYRKTELMPLHPGCDCGVEPFISASDPGQVLDQKLLDQAHTLIDEKLNVRDSGARDLGNDKFSTKGQPISDFTDLIVTNEHGELGPTLGWRVDTFTGPAGLI